MPSAAVKMSAEEFPRGLTARCEGKSDAVRKKIQASVREFQRQKARKELDARREAFRKAAEWISKNERGIGGTDAFARRVGEVAHERFRLPAVFSPSTIGRNYWNIISPFFILAPQNPAGKPPRHDSEITVREAVEALKRVVVACPDQEFREISTRAAKEFGLHSYWCRAPDFIRDMVMRDEDGVEELKALRARYDYLYRQTFSHELRGIRNEIHQSLLPHTGRNGLGILTDMARGGRDEFNFLKDVIADGYIPEVRLRCIDEVTRDYLAYFHLRKIGGGESFYVLYIHDAVDFSTVAKRLASQRNVRSRKWNIPVKQTRRANLIKRLEAGDTRFPDVRYAVFYEKGWSGRTSTPKLESRFKKLTGGNGMPDDVKEIVARIDMALAALSSETRAGAQKVKAARGQLAATIFMAQNRRGKKWHDVTSEACALEVAIKNVQSAMAAAGKGGGGGILSAQMHELCAIPDYATGFGHPFFPLRSTPPDVFLLSSGFFAIPLPL